ncbi:class I SAM-dependent methyltransferase [Synechococcus sp. CBW1107]|uniref:SAM-dependent methyltransferase n=2 Tax=unclassified Synechococcus TaxID=2626047 RepID=UPI002AD223C2|nr:class I SAM-dependent methyltransferase [Synechococcus sp. CBW1107]CAK6702004.1 hypothetical protein IFHNHDMJ_03324 [Synechococcus sp. CBW1107]
MTGAMVQHLDAVPPMTSSLPPSGAEGVAELGHRRYVGGLWEEIGQLQFDFLLAQGLQPSHVLLDIACGALRLGVKVIPYLEPEHYLGMEKEAALLQAGLEQELTAAVRHQKRPQLLQGADFSFERFGRRVDRAMAQSLFTHLPPAAIEQCLQRLRPCLQPDGVFYATYFEVQQEQRNPTEAHDHGFFAYTKQQMEGFGEAHGYRAEYIGAWNHPRDQVMVAYRPAP